MLLRIDASSEETKDLVDWWIPFSRIAAIKTVGTTGWVFVAGHGWLPTPYPTKLLVEILDAEPR